MRAGNRLRVGVDLTSISAVERSVTSFGAAYLERVFTAAELESCRGGDMMASLAARFAAKEATIKALQPSDEPIDWRTIEVVKERSGACRIVLSGRAAAIADRAGIHDIALSLTHEGDCAAAVVVARRSRGWGAFRRLGLGRAGREAGKDR
jgi:holo-[acyl-carrier protein] synthase